MDIERLKELKQQIKGVHDGINGDDLNLLYGLLPLVDEAIACQSATSDEVAEATSWVTNTRHRNQYMSGDWTAPMGNHINRTIQDTIITALQAYQPKESCTIEFDDPEYFVGECSNCEYEIDPDYGWSYCPGCGGRIE